MSTSAYKKQVDSILEVVENYTKEELTQAGQRLQNILLDENPDLDKNDTLDVAVSCDGTWAKQGFTSLRAPAGKKSDKFLISCHFIKQL